MSRQVMGFQPVGATPAGSKDGCVLLPTRGDTILLEENFSNRPELTTGIDFYVFDDNPEKEESLRVQRLCETNGWHYRKTGIGQRVGMRTGRDDQATYTRFLVDAMASLALDYEYVIRMMPSTYITCSSWYDEFSSLLIGRSLIAGCLEKRPARDATIYGELAKRAGWKIDFSHAPMVMHGGIYGMGRKAVLQLAQMPFPSGRHAIGEDCYISYCCHALGIESVTMKTVGAWSASNRPGLEKIASIKVVHPLRKNEWMEFFTHTQLDMGAC